MPRLRFTVAYDGTDFHGWQRQAGVRTVQEVLEDTATRVGCVKVRFLGASRTDAGVHACGQVACTNYTGPLPAENLRRATNHRLPLDVTLVDVRAVDDGFDPIRDARCKLYRYDIHNGPDRPPDPRRARYVWHVIHPLDGDAMSAAAQHMVGTHDFTSFATTGSPRESNVRTVREVTVRRAASEITIDVVGDGFLYNQVRNMVGTLMEIGRGRWRPEYAAEIIAARDRAAAAGTAPPQGLCLQWVCYDGDAERTS